MSQGLGDRPNDLIDAMYEHRFSPADAAAKDEIWREIAAHLQRFVVPGQPVLDVACDRGDFIRNIVASEKWATDLRDVRDQLPDSISFVRCSGVDIPQALPNQHFGTVFMSNYLEHLANVDVVLDQLIAAYTVTRPGGRIIILQPNIRLVHERYWDFLDHRVALTETNLREACELAGYLTERIVVRFLPYTTKSRLPQSGRLVRAYLAFPPAWLLLGKQTLYVGRRPAGTGA